MAKKLLNHKLLAFVIAATLLLTANGCSVFSPRKRTYALYTLKRGDTLYKLANRFGATVDEIQRINDIDDADVVHVGNRVKIPLKKNLLRGRGVESMRASLQSDIFTERSDMSHLERAIVYRGRLLWPVEGGPDRLSSDFGSRWSNFHEGIDFSVPRGTPVYAAHDGNVIYTGERLRGYGKIVIIKDSEKLLVTIYAHNDRVHVSPGDTVSAGQEIAHSGNTGKSTGPHLHFETRIVTEKSTLLAVNPLDFYMTAH